MKKIIALIMSIGILFSLLPQTFVAAAEYTEEEKIAAEQLFVHLNPADKRTSAVYSAFKARDYKKALVLYRNYFIDKLRVMDVGQLGWHDSNIAATYVGMADIISGKMSITQFNQKFGEREHYDFLEWNGDPNEKKPVNWLGGMDSENDHGQAAGLGFEVNLRRLNALAGAYWVNDFDSIYLKKYIQIAEDYFLNEKRVTDQYLKENSNIEPDVRFWMEGGKYAQNYLWLFERVDNVLRCMAIFSKLLPTKEEFVKPEWANVVKPVYTTLKEESYEAIDPLFIARMSYSFITDHMTLAQNVLRDNFLIANQHAHGVMSFAKLMDVYDEFSICDQYDDRVEHALNYLVEGIILPDGSLTERSFNYNEGTIKSFQGLVDWMSHNEGQLPSWAPPFIASVNGWNRMYNAYNTSTGYIPNIGNGGSTEKAAAIWADQKAYEKRKEETDGKYDKQDFKSIYFPYGGYGVLRSGYDILKDMSLNYYSNNKASAGHISQMVNAIWLSAYGRPLIASGGTPWYGEGFAPESQLKNYEILNRYFTEQSSYKGSTVIVNHNTQAKGTKKVSDILSNSFMAGENFDYANGLWDGGYTTIGGANINSAVHLREYIYVKQAGLYIVADNLTNTLNSENLYSQIWRMPSYSKDISGHTGFSDDKVIVDSKDNLLKTIDSAGPNVWISNFSLSEMNYVRHYGELSSPVALGWGNGGVGGERIPATDIYVEWKDKGAGSRTKMISVLDPVPDDSKPFQSKTDISDAEKGITGFTYITEDNVKVTCLSSFQPQELVYGDIKVTAEMMIVTEKEGEDTSVLVTNANSVTVGDNVTEYDKESFEFAVKETPVVLNKALVPTYFLWVDKEDGKYSPKYDVMDKEKVAAINTDLKNKVNLIRTLTYSDAHYLVSYSDYVAKGFNVLLKNIPDMPTEAATNEFINILSEFIRKNTEIAKYYGKIEYSDKIIGVFGNLFEDVAFCAKNQRNAIKYYSIHKGFMELIIENASSLNPNNEKVEYFKQILDVIEQNEVNTEIE